MIPAELERLRALPGGAGWLERLPRLVRECAGRWDLELGAPFSGGATAFVAPAGDVVLKVGFPHEEAEHEALVLRLWDGCGAVRLVDEDPARHALLLERCRPGTALLELDDDAACDVVSALLPRLWSVPPPTGLRRLQDVAARWTEELPALQRSLGGPCDDGVLAEALAALRELGPSQGELTIGNEDLHAGNVLASEREPWLLIDPKPLAAERDFGPVAMVRDRMEEVLDGPRPSARIRNRLDRMASDLDLDRERVRRWTIAHTVAWGFDAHGFDRAHGELARLLLEL